MLDFVAHDAFEKVASLGGVIEIIGERVRNRLGHYDLGGEMRNGVDAVFCDQGIDESAVAKVSDNEFRPHWDGPREPG